MNNKLFASLLKNPYIQLHFCILLWGFTGILGKAINIDALPLVMWRMLIVVLLLCFFAPMWKTMREFKKRDYLIVGGIGCLVALHWVTFYGSIKLANASVAVTALALGSIFSAFLEPYLLKRPFEKQALFLSITAVLGISVITGGLNPNFLNGFLLGCFSAFVSSCFSILNKKYTKGLSVFNVTFIEFICGILFILALAFFSNTLDEVLILPTKQDWILLIILSVFCTLLPFCLLLQILKKVSAFDTQLAINLEPIYTIILAIIIFQEQQELNAFFYLGISLIIGSVLIQTWWKNRPQKHS